MHGNLKSKFTDWKSEAISLVISKEFPPCRIVTGIKRISRFIMITVMDYMVPMGPM